MSANRLAAWLLLGLSVSSARGEAPAVETCTDLSVSSARGEASGAIVVPAEVIDITREVDREPGRKAEAEEPPPWPSKSDPTLLLSLSDFYGGNPFCTCYTIALSLFCLYLVVKPGGGGRGAHGGKAYRRATGRAYPWHAPDKGLF